MTPTRSVRRQKSAEVSFEWLELIAEEYTQLEAAGQAPITMLAKMHNAVPSTASRWVARARREALFPRRRQGQ